MMLGELRKPSPVNSVAENLLDSGRELSLLIFAAAGQNQIQFRIEVDGISSIWKGKPGCRSLWQAVVADTNKWS